MGADLIGYFAKGPKKLPKRAMPAAIAEAERRLEWLRKARPIVETGHYTEVVDLLEDCPWLDRKGLQHKVDEVDFKQLHAEFEHLLDTIGDVTGLTGEQAVKDFVEAWPPNFRDTAHIVDPDCPDKLIVFAGERTWGDPPGRTWVQDARPSRHARHRFNPGRLGRSGVYQPANSPYPERRDR